MIPVESERKPVIAIIGGGFCGTLTAVHLLSQKEIPLHIILINSKYPLSKGIAYSSYSNKHMLNVNAKNMSAFPDKSDHFIKWIHNSDRYSLLGHGDLPEMFLPRNIYGYYLKEIFDNSIRKKSENISIEFVHDEAIDIEPSGKRAKISFSVSPPVYADKTVLATGNYPPRQHPKMKNDFCKSKKYFGNPWLHEAVKNVERKDKVLIIGNGLTMVDVVIGLREEGHSGKIYSLSPHGFDILPHRKFEPYPDLLNELQPPYDLVKVIKIFRSHVHKLRAKNISGEAVVDSVRPLSQKIWMSWSKREKERFMYYVRHMWGVARHRLPMEIHIKLQQFILDDTLEIIAGNLDSIKEYENGVTAKIKHRKRKELLELNIARVINCTGPECDITQVDNELIKNLLSRNLITADEMRLGMEALPDGTIIDKDGNHSSLLYTLGSPLRGILWESTAVPELRFQARQLAAKLVTQLSEISDKISQEE